MKKVMLNSLISIMVMISGFSLAVAATNVEFKFQSNPTDEQIFKATVMLLKYYKFDLRHEDAQASSIKAVREITKGSVYYLEFSIDIKEKQISVTANITKNDPALGVPPDPQSEPTVFGKTVSAPQDGLFPGKSRSEQELHDARWLIGKVIRTIGTRLDALEFRSQIAR